MTATTNKTQTRWGILAVILVTAIASTLILSCLGTALAQEGLQENRGSLSGQIVGLSSINNMSAVTLRLGHMPNDTLTIFLNKDTKLQVCNESYPLMWAAGRNATVTYHERGGAAIAESIYEKC